MYLHIDRPTSHGVTR